jgi:hypothetical protein
VAGGTRVPEEWPVAEHDQTGMRLVSWSCSSVTREHKEPWVLNEALFTSKEIS